MNAIRIADVLNQVAGVKAGTGSVSIHGSTKVRVLLDGRPINDPTASHGGIKWDMVALENIERIEILRGKGGLRYGDDAGGGVILITTKAIDRFNGNIRVYGGNHDTRHINANVNAMKGDFGGSVSAAYDTTGGYKVNNDEIKKQAGARFTYRPRETFSAVFSADHFQETQGNSGLPAYPTPRSRTATWMDSLSLAATAAAVTAKTYYNDGAKHNTDPDKKLDNMLRVRQAGQEVTTGLSTDRWGDLSGGISATWGSADGTTVQNHEETGASVFGQVAYPLPGLPLTATAGLRGNIYSDFDGGVNPAFKINWRQGGWQATLGYNRASNVPSFHQRYNQTSSTRPNPDLAPETADNYSLALSAAPSAGVSAGMTLFYNELSDRITYVRGAGGIGQYQNFGKVTYTGADFSLGWEMMAPLTLKAAYTYLEAVNEVTGLWLPAKPRHKANGELRCALMERLTLVVGVDYASSVFTRADNSTAAPEYAIAHVRGEYRLDRLSLFAEIRNLGDRTYYYADGNLAPPRTWLIGTKWNF